MAHAEVCPTCKGSGRNPLAGQIEYGTIPGSTAMNSYQHGVICPGCGGKGWVEVKDG